MTSPGINKPSQNTNGRYEGVYSKGSSFGQGLNEARVREILSTEVRSPFGRLVDRISDRFNEFAGDIASAIRKDKGAKYEVISGAVDERLGPIDTAISESGNRMVELSDKVDEQIREQDRISKEQAETLVRVDAYASEAEKNRKDLDAYEAQRKQDLVVVTAKAQKGIDDAAAYRKAMEDADKAIRTDVQTALRSAESAQKSADGKSANYYGTTAPKSPVNGDTWFKPVQGGSQILVFESGKWVQKTDWAKVNADLAANKQAVDQAALDVADAQAKVKNLVDEELPAIKAGTAEFDQKLKDETKARTTALSELQTSLNTTKTGLDTSMEQLETRLKDADKKLEDRVGEAASKQLELAKQELNRSLDEANRALATAREDLDTLSTSRPGNVFPDPHFRDPCWKRDANMGSNTNNGGELRITGQGRQTGLYYQPKGYRDKSIMLERGGKYLLTATVYRSANFPDGRTVSVHMRQPGVYVGRPGVLPTGPVGTSVESAILDIPGSIAGGGSTLGFFLESNVPEGSVSIWDVQIVRAADNAMIIDGAVTAAKVQAGAIETAKLAADAVTADKIKAGAIVAGKLAANSVAATNLQADSVTANAIKADQILSKHIKANQVTATEIASNTITALQIAAGTITANELGANSVTAKQLTANSVNASALQANSVKADHLVANQITGDKLTANAITSREVKANSIMAEHMVIGGPANMIANGSFTEGKEPWHPDLEIRTIGASQALPPGNAYAITKPGQSTLEAHTGNQWMTVAPEGLYAFEIWLYADKPGSRFYLELRNQYGSFAGAAQRERVSVGDISSAGGGSYLVNNVEVRTGWNKYSTVYKMGKNTTRARLGGFYFNHPNGSEQNARVAFSGVSLRPMADADLIVDGAILAQHIKAGTITSAEIAAGTITGDKLKADTITGREVKSGTINANQLKVDNGFIKTAMIGDGQITNAKMGSLDAGKITSGTLDAKRIGADSITVKELRANTIIPIGGSLIHHEPPPDDPTKPPQPVWWQACDSELAANYSGWPRPEGNPWRTATSGAGKQGTQYVPKRLVKVKAGQPYKLKVWLRASKPYSKMFIEMRNQDGALPKITGAPYTGNTAVKWYNDSANGWDVADFTGTTRTSGYLLDNYTIHSYPTLVTSTVVFDPGTDYVYLNKIYFNHPNGSEQTADQWIAGLSLELDIPNQADVDAAQNRAIEANTMAVKMLGRIDPGSSLVDYLTPSEADLKNLGKEVNWAIPQWTTACTKTGSERGIQWWGYSGAKTAKETTKLFRPVIPNQEYKLTFEAKGSDQLTMAVDTEGEGPHVLSSRRVVSRSSTSVPVYEDQKVDNDFVVRGAKLSSDWDTYTYLVKFGSGITHACISSIWWNDGGGSRAQYIRNLEFRPNIMMQKEVDDAQTAAIRSLESFERQQNDLNESQKKTNRLVEAQVWMHQDLIELLDIRTPKTYGWPATTGGWSYCPAAAQSGYYISTPYYEQWEVGDGKGSSVYIYCRGQWTGWIVASINWDSGVTDEWSVEVTKTDRIFRFTGGAYHIKKRFIGMTVYPRSLNRTASISRVENPGYIGWSGSYSTSRWDGIWDPNKLFRVSYTAGIRLKNTVVCDKTVWVRDENDRQTMIYAGRPIYAAVIYPEDQIYMGPYTFTEVDDPVPQDDRTGYSIDSVRPSGSAITYSSHVN